MGARKGLVGIALATALATATLVGGSSAQAAPAMFDREATSYRSATSGNITTVSDSSGWVATFTKGARTVTVRTAARTFSEPNATRTVTSAVAVRLLPAPFSGTVDETWLQRAQASTAPDALALALQYVAGAPDRHVNSLRVAGDATYGPRLPDGTLAPGADFNDFLGISYAYGSSSDAPEANEFGSLDCSGYIRMLYGYRLGYPMTRSPSAGRLPRTAAAMAGSGPGTLIVPNSGSQVAVTSAIRPGDLLFFDASTRDGTTIDHVAIFLGRDSAGRARFISSRRTPNGPTMSDSGAYSLIDGTGYYAKALRSVRRI